MQIFQALNNREVFQPNTRILYLGDDDKDRAAAYLLCILTQTNAQVSYVSSREKVDADKFIFELFSLVIVSDYPRKQGTEAFWDKLATWVENGGKFLMIGGWESFYGKNGEYNDSRIEDILPVTLGKSDDRFNAWQGVLVHPGFSVYPGLSSLDWSLPPVIAGYNRFEKKPEAITLLHGYSLSVKNFDGKLNMVAGDPHPLACTMRIGEGVSTAVAFDFAPHWVGGAVDWGRNRVLMTLPPENEVWVETGNLFRDLVELLIRESMSM